MKLSDYMERNGISDARGARELGCSSVSLNLIRRGKRQVAAVLALEIEEWTHGDVKAEDLPLSTGARRDLKLIRGWIENGGD